LRRPHRALEELRAFGAEVVDARAVDDGDFMTAGGVTSGLDLALWLAQKHFGTGVSSTVEEEIEYERGGQVAVIKEPRLRSAPLKGRDA